ncbi:MAG: hypothetical protein RMM98_17490, partial [Acidobacteriota bacterium]|nr:hypothetical protein [Acidobacteriota bacterium]
LPGRKTGLASKRIATTESAIGTYPKRSEWLRDVGTFELKVEPVLHKTLLDPETAAIGNTKVGFGKYANVRARDLFKRDASYAVWFADNAQATLHARKIAQYLRSLPEYYELKYGKIALARELLTPEVAQRLSELGLKATLRDNGRILVSGETYGYKDIFKEVTQGYRGRFVDGGWELDPDAFSRFATRIGTRVPDVSSRTGHSPPSGGQDIEVSQPGETVVQRADRRGLGRPAGDYVRRETRDLILQGERAGIPRQVLDE